MISDVDLKDGVAPIKIRIEGEQYLTHHQAASLYWNLYRAWGVMNMGDRGRCDG